MTHIIQTLTIMQNSVTQISRPEGEDYLKNKIRTKIVLVLFTASKHSVCIWNIQPSVQLWSIIHYILQLVSKAAVTKGKFSPLKLQLQDCLKIKLLGWFQSQQHQRCHQGTFPFSNGLAKRKHVISFQCRNLHGRRGPSFHRQPREGAVEGGGGMLPSSSLHAPSNTGSHSFSSLAILEAMFLKPMDVPEMRLKRTPLSDKRGNLHTSISHCTSESVLGSP